MTFSRKVLSMPALAGVCFIGVVLINEAAGTANARLIRDIQDQYLPALELQTDVEASLREVQRALQDAVAVSEIDGLRAADAARDELMARLRAGRANRAFRADEVVSLESAIVEYYEGARSTAERMIMREAGDSLHPALETLPVQYTGLRRRLGLSTRRQRSEMAAALEQAMANHRRSVQLMTAALLLALVALLLVSRLVIRSTLGSLREAVSASATLAGRASALPPRALPASGDEIALLLASMHEMMTAVARSEARLSEAQRLARVGSWEWDAASGRVTWSEELHRILGVDGPALSDLEACLALVHGDDRQRVQELVRNALRAREPLRSSFRLVRPDGEVRSLVAHSEFLQGAGGTVIGKRGAIQDVTESERTAAALRDSEAYRTLFENNPQPMWVYDPETLRFLAVNAAMVNHYGYSRDEFLAMSITDIRPEEDRAALLARVASAPDGLWKNGVWRHRHRNGSLLEIETTSHSVPFGSRAARLVLANDVTEQGRLEQQLRQAQKMEAVGRLAGGVAHDFNNLLFVMGGYAEQALRRLGPDHPLREKLGGILRASERGAALTRQLLTFSRREPVQPKVLSLNSVVAEMEQMLRRLLGEQVELRTDLDGELGRTRIDPGHLEQVLMNLVVNARDAMPKGGRLTIETANVDVDERYARLRVGLAPGRYVMLAVSDTGHGMDEATMEHIFEPFFTTKGSDKGTGLGLSIIYGIVKQAGGQVSVYSEPGRGATFKVYLPRTDQLVEAPPASREWSEPRGSETVLLVEDEVGVRQLARETLEDHGYRVIEAVNGKEAIRLAGELAQPLHLLLTDVVLPDLIGPEVASEIGRSRDGLPVLYMSGYTGGALAGLEELPENVAFLPKPFTLGALLRRTREVLDNSSRLRAGIALPDARSGSGLGLA